MHSKEQMRASVPEGSRSAAQHSQSFESWFAHLPGVVVVCPSTPQDNHDLLRAALDCGDPVIYMEHKELWPLQGELQATAPAALGQARRWREGRDLTLVSWSRQMHWAAEAAQTLADEGVQADLIDLRTLWPWDRDAVFASAERTRRVLVVHEAVQVAGFGAEIVATLAEAGVARVARLGAPRAPVGYSPGLEARARIDAAKVADAARGLLRRG